MTLIEEVLAGFAGLVLAVLLFFLLKRLFRRSVSIQALVSRKTLYALPDGSHGNGVETGCFVSFRHGATTRLFPVPLSVFNTLNEGDRGILTYKGARFIRFVTAKL